MSSIYGGFLQGTPIAGWFTMENPMKIWMRTGYPPHDLGTSTGKICQSLVNEWNPWIGLRMFKGKSTGHPQV